MSKPVENLNLPRDIAVFEYVAGTQSELTKAQFELALEDNLELQAEVESEQAFRSLIESAQTTSEHNPNNIDALFEQIDAEEGSNQTSNASHKSASVIPFNKSAQCFAVAASLFLAIFLTINLDTNQASNADPLLEPNFMLLTAATGESIDINKLADEQRLIKFTLADSLSSAELDSLLKKHGLERLSQSLNENIIIAHAGSVVDSDALLSLTKDRLIKDAELVKFN